MIHERAKKEAAQVFLRLWVDRGRMPDADTAKYLIDAFDTFAADAVREEREALADIVFDATGREDLVRVIRARTPASGEEKG